MPRRSSLLPMSGLSPMQVDVVLDEHDVALGVLRIHAAAGVADDQHLAAQRLHDAHRQGDLLERIAFVEVEAPLHRHDGLAGQLAADQPAGVRGDRRVRESAECRRREASPRPAMSSARPPRPVPRMMPMRGLPVQRRSNGRCRFLNLVVQIHDPWSVVRCPLPEARFSGMICNSRSR